jgi:hypothetical protein
MKNVVLTKKDRGNIEKQLTAWELTGEERDVGRMLLGSLLLGPSWRRMAVVFEIAPLFAQQVGGRLRESGVWTNRKVHCAWFDEDGGIAFHMDICVGLGWIKRAG